MLDRWKRDRDKDLLRGLGCKESYALMLRILHDGFMFEWMEDILKKGVCQEVSKACC